MSQEEKNAALDGSSKEHLSSSYGASDGLSASKGFGGLKSGLFTSNTILEELSGHGSSNNSPISSSNKHLSADINFPGLLSTSDPFNAGGA